MEEQIERITRMFEAQNEIISSLSRIVVKQGQEISFLAKEVRELKGRIK